MGYKTLSPLEKRPRKKIQGHSVEWQEAIEVLKGKSTTGLKTIQFHSWANIKIRQVTSRQRLKVRQNWIWK